jgi:hypothetical protein
MELPCCAIGGITAANCAPLVQAIADFLAVVGAVWGIRMDPLPACAVGTLRLRRFVICPGQLQQRASDAILLVRRQIAHGCKRFIEKVYSFYKISRRGEETNRESLSLPV